MFELSANTNSNKPLFSKHRKGLVCFYHSSLPSDIGYKEQGKEIFLLGEGLFLVYPFFTSPSGLGGGGLLGRLDFGDFLDLIDRIFLILSSQ